MRGASIAEATAAVVMTVALAGAMASAVDDALDAGASQLDAAKPEAKVAPASPAIASRGGAGAGTLERGLPEHARKTSTLRRAKRNALVARVE